MQNLDLKPILKFGGTIKILSTTISSVGKLHFSAPPTFQTHDSPSEISRPNCGRVFATAVLCGHFSVNTHYLLVVRCVIKNNFKSCFLNSPSRISCCSTHSGIRRQHRPTNLE